MSAAQAARPGRFPRVALFDLDGTLLDSAPDMLATVNAMRAARGRGPMAMDALRPVVSKGARAMAAAAFPDVPADERNGWIPEFLERYEQALGHYGTPFDGIETMLARLEAAGSAWGIVTNKPEYLARKLMPLLGWESRCAILIGGDTLAERKPHPLPLLHAARALNVSVDDCVYVGDDERDIVSARAAGMRSVVALWGYRLDEDDPAAWQGDVLHEAPHALIAPEGWPA
jgi:phosphoglycolate phosphatase